MILERTKNTKRSLIWGILNALLKIGLPFAVRTVMIYTLGVQYVGVNSLFTSILSILSLAELGFDSAVVCVMYKAIAEDNEKKIAALLRFLKIGYYIVGAIILGVGLCCLPFIKYLIKDADSIPGTINIYIPYLIFLCNTAVSYFCGGYRNSILNAFQRRDVISNIGSIVLLGSSIVQIVILLFVKNYYAYVITVPIFTIITNILIVIISNRLYPTIKAVGKLTSTEKKEVIKVIKGTFLAKVGGVTSSALDNIVVSSFIGITILSFFSNYTYIVTAIQGIVAVISFSLQAGIGNSLCLDSVEKNYKDFICLSFICFWLVGFCAFALYFLFQQFIILWIGEEGVLAEVIVICICLNFYFSTHDTILGTYKAALGIWWQDRYRCLIGAIVNFVLNITVVLLVKNINEQYALLGVIVATIVSQLVVLTPWATAVTFKEYFKNGFGHYIKIMIACFGCALFSLLLGILINYFLPIYSGPKGVGFLFLRILITLILPNLCYFLIFFRTKVFKESFKLISSKLRKRKHETS